MKKKLAQMYVQFFGNFSKLYGLNWAGNLGLLADIFSNIAKLASHLLTT